MGILWSQGKAKEEAKENTEFKEQAGLEEPLEVGECSECGGIEKHNFHCPDWDDYYAYSPGDEPG